MTDNGIQKDEAGKDDGSLLNDDDAFIIALVSGKSIREAAKMAGIAERTASRRAGDSEIRARVLALRGEVMARAIGKLADGMAEAADTLRVLLVSKEDPVRLSAARTILETGHRLRKAVEVEERLTALEESVAEAKS